MTPLPIPIELSYLRLRFSFLLTILSICKLLCRRFAHSIGAYNAACCVPSSSLLFDFVVIATLSLRPLGLHMA